MFNRKPEITEQSTAHWRTIVCLSMLLGSGQIMGATTTGEDKPAPAPLERSEAQRFAQELSRIIEQVSEKYVRPVSRAELAAAALAGLYRAARVPVPPSLRAEVLKAADDAYELHRLMAHSRESLGKIETLQSPQALLASLRGLTEALDPFSVILTGSELERADGSTAPQHGLGLAWQVSHSPSPSVGGMGGPPLVLKAVAPGGPAQKAGLRPGDQITHVDGQPVTGSLNLSARLAQERGVQLGVYRPSTQAAWKVTLRPESFQPETVLGVIRGPDNAWDYFLDHERRIAQVRIGALERGTAAELARVLSELTAAGMRGLLLDLRWSPGGSLPEATAIADLFIAGYVLPHFLFPTPGNLLGVADLFLTEYPKNAAVVYRDRIDDHHPPMDPGYIHFPIVVLINSETSGGGELIAAVLRDNLRARIAGQRSRGKASVQIIQPLQEYFEPKGVLPPAALKLSTGMLIRPNGRNLHRFSDSKLSDDWGVRPDPKLDFRVSPDLGRQLRDWWQLQDLRPGTSNECLPLDDPVADPQRQAALQMLIDLTR